MKNVFEGRKRLETYIRLVVADGDQYEPQRQSYTLEEMGGCVPAAGDVIVDPGVLAGRDRQQPENRTVYEVLRRYFREASTSHGTRIDILVRERAGRPNEIDLLGE